MTSQFSSRGTALTAAALLLGGAFFAVGATYSGHQANAATTASPVATLPTLPTGTATVTGGITVTGTSQVAGTPDTLRLDLDVTTTAPTVGKALDQANALTAKVQASLRRSGVAAKDLQTSSLQIQPEYSYPSSGKTVLTGYTVTEGVSAQLRDLGRAGAAITAAVGAGGNALRVNGISLALEDTGKLVTAAREKAVADARAKADQYAKATGRPLGQAVSITEAISNPPPVDYGMVGAQASALKAVPIAPGSENVSVTVTIVYAFG